jgi:hypothetical protein
MPALPPKPTAAGPPGKKRESKWGKVSSGEPSILPAASEQGAKEIQKPSLELEQPGVSLELSEDKSIDYMEEEPH